MAYSEDGDNVVLTMSREDFQMLLIVLGYATGGAIKDHWTPASRMFELTNRLNEGNPHYTPYQEEG
jgi:nicotinamide mononucleotide adenylyltransferase